MSVLAEPTTVRQGAPQPPTNKQANAAHATASQAQAAAAEGSDRAQSASTELHGGQITPTPASVVPAVDPLGDITFLYKLVPGHVAPSFGLNCARLAGMTDKVVTRAAEVWGCTRLH